MYPYTVHLHRGAWTRGWVLLLHALLGALTRGPWYWGWNSPDGHSPVSLPHTATQYRLDGNGPSLTGSLGWTGSHSLDGQYRHMYVQGNMTQIHTHTVHAMLITQQVTWLTLVIDAIPERYIDRVELALLCPNLIHVTWWKITVMHSTTHTSLDACTFGDNELLESHLFIQCTLNSTVNPHNDIRFQWLKCHQVHVALYQHNFGLMIAKNNSYWFLVEKLASIYAYNVIEHIESFTIRLESLKLDVSNSSQEYICVNVDVRVFIREVVYLRGGQNQQQFEYCRDWVKWPQCQNKGLALACYYWLKFYHYFNREVVFPLTCSREEEIAKLVEWDGHNSISEIECFLHPITMVNVYVNVQHSRMVPGDKGRMHVCICVNASTNVYMCVHNDQYIVMLLTRLRTTCTYRYMYS